MLPRQQQKNFNFSWSSPVKGLFLAVIFIFSFSQLLVATTSIPAGSPVVITSSYTSSSNAVTVNGNVTSENGSTVTERGIVYGTAAAPTLSNNKIASGAGTGTFSAVTPTLSPGIYFFRAYATNSSGTSYGAELTTTICSPNLPTLLFKLSPPDITTSAIQGQPGIRTENFNTQATGEIPASGTVANGTYTKTGPADRKVVIEPNAVWGGTESQYLSLMTNAVLNITLTDPSRYLGFWWGGGDDYNRVTIFGSCGGNEIQLGQFTTSSVTNLLAGPTVTAVDGNSYPSASYRRANAFNQSFAFINLELSDPNVYFTRMEVTQSGGGYFEIDNITSGTVYGAASYTTPSAMTISSITAGGNLTVNFNAPSSNGGQPITNFEYSTNGGTNWVAASPVVTTSPLVISGLSTGTTYSVRIRAVNSIGYGPESVAVNATPIAVAPVITSFTPTSAVTGATVTLTGTDFTGATAVSFGGTAATSFNVVSATSITAVVAAGTSGDVSVTTPGGTAVLAGFTFIPTPVITSFSPASGSVGTLVTIAGTNLETPTAFTIGGTAAIVISNTGTSLVGMVMPGAATGTISLTTAGGSATSAATFTLSTTTAPNTQQGAKLVGTGISGSATLGYSVSLSADGNTAIVGGYNDNSFRGAAWVFTRSGATWSQQGAKLVATDGGNFTSSNAVKNSRLGFSVSLSADGNTAIVGGYTDNLNKGAAWIFTRSGTTWTQQGNKLVGTGGTSTAYQGHAVSISADGNTAIVGGYFDNNGIGAAWIYTRNGTTWTQQGNKLVGTGNTGNANQGRSVSLSADGKTAIVGGWTDNLGIGSAWIFTRSGTSWTQQGAKLVGTGNTGNANQGFAVSLSADGNTAILGGLNDATNKGAAWIFTRSGTTWTQQGNKLVGTGAVNAKQGHSVSISADGNTVIVGGYFDNSNQGAAWIYTRNGTTWRQLGDKLVGTGAVGTAYQGNGVSLSADGTTAMVGGASDNSSQGAVWVYNYVQPPPPTITSFTPTSSVTGATVTLTGTNFTGATAVSFGGIAATSYTVVSSTSITAVVAAATSGNVSVTTWGGTAVLAGFTFIPTPVITSFTPTSAATGATVTITGTDFTGATAVSFGGTAATSFNVVSATSITAVVAAGTSGNVSVINPDGTGVLAGFTFIPAPVITSFTPTSAGPTATVTLTGTNFTGATAVSFGGTAATSFTVVSATSITAVIAAGTSGDVSVTTPGGTGVLAGFTFVPAPVITSFTPTSVATGATVTLTGTDFTGATAVSFGGAAATSFTVVSATSITAVVSALGASGNVSVTTPGGTAVLAGFTFPPPVITSFSPASGPVGTLVTITGTNLGNPTAFTIGGATAIVISNTGTSLVGMVMPGAVTGTISLTTASGSATSTGTFTLSATPAPNTQQGAKLVGTGNTGAAGQGYAVSISADGTTAIVGGLFNNSDQGAAWIYTRSGSTWTQQGTKLVGTGAVGTSQQGVAVSLSADGNTAIVGGDEDDALKGAAWIFTRSGTTWTQQGAKLVGTGAIGTAGQGRSVSLSADGNTAIVGGSTDNSSQGAVWIFTRSGTTWTQQGAKLVGTGAIGTAQQGRSVSLSADGNTAILGGYFDNTGQGAVWIFTRSGTTWTQQGAKLVGTGAVGAARQGQAVSLSADGNTAIVGGNADKFITQGAAWIFTRSGATWSQQGTKLVGTGYTGAVAGQGWAVSLSADGNTAILGGYADNSDQGAAWIFTRSGTTWSQQGAKLVGTGAVGAARQGWAVSLSADGTTAILGGYADNTEQGAVWAYNYVPPPPIITSFTPTSAATGATVTLSGTDFTGATAVSFGGTAATSFTVVSATSITAVLAAGTSGNVSVTTLGGTGVLAGFTFIPAPTITSATYNASTGVLVVTGTNLEATAGATNDIDVSKLSLTGEGGSSYTLTTSNVELTNATSFSITLNATDIAAVNQILNKNGTSSTGSTTYNIAAADNWNPAMTGSADLTGNAVVVSDVAVPTLTSATYDLVSGSLVVTGTNLLKLSGATNDIDVTKLTFTGQGGSTVTLTSNTTNVEITNGTSFTVSLGPTDKTSVNALLNKNGTSSVGGTTYNLAAAEDWNAGADPAVVLADLTANGITVSNVANVAAITASGTLAALTTIYATASSNTSFSVSGAFLTNDIIVTAPSGFEVSVSPTSGFGSTVTLTQTSGTVSITTVYVRLKSNSTVAGSPYSGDVTCTSTNAQTVNVATVSSTVTALGLTITGVTASNKEYDANTTATLGGTATLVGVVTADQANVTLAGTATATFNNASVGTNKAVTVTGYTLGGTAAGNYTVSQPTGLTANITAKAASSLTIDPIANQTYTGSALTPAIVVKDGTTTLTFGTDYTVAYSNNTNVGTATVTITGMGIYTGTKTQTFTILPKAVNTLSINPITNLIYTGAAITPLSVVKDGNTTLLLGTDYSVSCYNNTNAGTAKLTITGIGNYTGTKDEAFNILPKAVNTLSIDPITNLIYTGAAITPLSVVKDGNITLTLGTDYSVSCYNNTNAGTAKLTITGIGNYTSTKNENFNILPKALTIQANNASKIYGDANPSLSFTYSGLVEGDIEIDQVPGISTSATTTSGVGTYPVTLTGGSDPNYSLTLVEGALEVSPAPLSLTVNAATKIYGQVDPVYTYSLQGLKGSDTEAVLVGAFSREAGEDPSSYRISQGSISAGANYNLTITETRLQILKARVLSVTELTGVTTAWSKEAVLPTTVNLLAAHGQNFQVEVKWDKSKLNLLSRGTYSLTGTLLLPVGIENPDQVLAKIKVQVLPKPAPRDVTITNNTFVGSTTVFFIPVGAFVVNDPVDNIHVVSFLGEGYDNSYFYIKNNILYWNSAERAPGKTTFSILIRVTDRDGNTIDKFFEIKRTRPDFSTVTIYNTFTPNGDRFNDTWGVQEIRFYEGARISVYDRGGVRVFYTENPDIRWDGTFNGKEMPIGSYFWVIQIEETGETRRGMVNVIRK